MTITTSLLGLLKASGSDRADLYLKNSLGATLDILDTAVTLTGSQTLTNKTLTSPTISGAVITPANLAAGATMVKLAELSGASASYDFTSIPQTYRHLMLVVYGRSDTAATVTGLRMRLQNVSTASYYDQALTAVGTTVTANESIAATTARVGFVAAASAAGSLMGTSQILILHYTQSNKEKPYVAQTTGMGGLTTGTIQLGQFGGVLDSTSAVDRVTILPAAGSFVADSIATLYGLPL